MEAGRLVQPGHEAFAAHRRRVEGAARQELLPLGQRTHAVEQLVVVGHLGRRGAGRGEDAAHHQVLHRHAERHAGGQVGPGLRAGDLGRVGQRLAVEHAQRPQRAGTPQRLGFDGVVHRQVHVARRQCARDVAATLQRQVLQPRGGGGLEQHADDLVFLLAAGAAQAQRAGRRAAHRIEQLLAAAVRRLGVDPQHELVERQHLHRRDVAPAEVHALGQRRGEQVGQRDDELVRVAARGLHVHQPFDARLAGLVDDVDRLRRQLVLGHQLLDQPRHLVGAAAGAGRHHQLDGRGGFPGAGRARGSGQHGAQDKPGAGGQEAGNACRRHDAPTEGCATVRPGVSRTSKARRRRVSTARVRNTSSVPLRAPGPACGCPALPAAAPSSGTPRP